MSATALEMLTAIKRAGAGIILTYWAKDVALAVVALVAWPFAPCRAPILFGRKGPIA